MSALEEIRINNSDIDLQFRPVTEMYNLLETHQTQAMDKDEGDAQNALEKKWTELVQIAETTRNSLQSQQSRFKQTLIQESNMKIVEVDDMKKNFEEKGPMVAGIAPRDAINLLLIFSEEYQVRKQRYESYYAGETLFGLPHQTYHALEETAKEIELLEKTLQSLLQSNWNCWKLEKHSLAWNS